MTSASSPLEPHHLFKGLRTVAKDLVSDAMGHYVDYSWRFYHNAAKRHCLPGTLTISLTSYPRRFKTLDYTIKSLLAQSVQPDHLVLWIAHNDFSQLPADVLKLQTYGLEVRPCEDLRSYKKIIPSLQLADTVFLVTADDDQYYDRTWLETLVSAYVPGSKEVICRRAHRIRLDDQGKPLPYLQWDLNVSTGSDAHLLFPTGAGGVLYRAGIFHEDVTRKDLFLKLCPTADDVWLYWMAKLNGAVVRNVGSPTREITWRDSQHVALYRTINRTANDLQIQAMICHYGLSAFQTTSLSRSVDNDFS